MSDIEFLPMNDILTLSNSEFPIPVSSDTLWTELIILASLFCDILLAAEKPVCTQAVVFPAGKSVLRHLLLAAGAPPGSSKGLQPHANVMAAKTAASQPLERSLPQAEGILQKILEF